MLELTGRLSIAVNALRHIKLPGVDQPFRGFDRSPYLAAFQAGSLRFLLASVHLYFGSDSKTNMQRRALEADAIGRWADLRRNDPHAYTPHIIALGDFNLPQVSPDDPIQRPDQTRARAARAPNRGRGIKPRRPPPLRPDGLRSRPHPEAQHAHRPIRL